MLHDEVMHLNRLVEDLYQLSLADINALSYRKEVTDLGETLRQAVEPFRGEFTDHGIELNCEIPAANTLLMQGDKRRLHQLFSNLLENSLRYTDAGGDLKIRATKNTDQITIPIRHRGAPGDMPHLVRPTSVARYNFQPSHPRPATLSIGMVLITATASAPLQ
jgi:two-component system sensor histidine kinase BaeS